MKSRWQEVGRAEWQEIKAKPTSDEPADPFHTPQNMLESEAEHDIVASYVRAEATESDSESDFVPEEEAVEEGPSPFQPTAGFTGKFPRGWRQRHERVKSPGHFE